MILTCSQCQSRFLLPDERFEGVARKVKCGQCGHVWRQEPPPPNEAEIAQRMAAVAEAMGGSEEDGDRLDQSAIDSLFDDLPPAGGNAGSEDTGADRKVAELAALLDGPAEDKDGRKSENKTVPEPSARAHSDLIDDSLPSAPEDLFADDLIEPIPDSLKFGALEDAAAARAKRHRRQMITGWASVAAAVVVMGSGVLFLRNQIAEAVPQTRPIYSLIGQDVDTDPTGLTFLEDGTFQLYPASAPGVQRLMIEGSLQNASARPKLVPQLRAEIYNGEGQMRFSWPFPPADEILQPGETTRYRHIIETDVTDIDDIQITFDVE